MTAGASARERWNARHARAQPAREPEPPSAWLVEHRAVLAAAAAAAPPPHARALDVACGRGRNALFLAELGFAVDAVDVSDVAVATVRERAARLGAPVRALRADLEHDPLPQRPYAAIVSVDYLQRSLFAPLSDALCAGGLLVLETFTRDHVRMNPAYTLAPGELRMAFPGLDVLDHRERDGRAAILARKG